MKTKQYFPGLKRASKKEMTRLIKGNVDLIWGK